MPPLTREKILHVARLSRLAIAEAEIPKRLEEFNDILAHIEKLSELNTDGIEPTSQVTAQEGLSGTPLAADEPVSSFTPDRAVANAPARQDHFFLVPRVVDQEAS